MVSAKIRRSESQIARNVATLERMARECKVSVGVFSDRTYPNGTPVALVAAVNEYGNETHPARPAFRDAMVSGARRFERTFARGCRAVMNGKGTASEAFDALAKEMRTAVKRKVISYGIYDTGRLYRSIAARRTKKGE